MKNIKALRSLRLAVNETLGLLVGHLVYLAPIRGIVLIVHSHDIDNRLIGTEG
jgi:hypothetical protein